jgi:uncharacterized membrane protein YkoI
MTKQEYLKYKQKDQMAILYEFYKERFDKNKHKPFLQRQEFDTFAHMVMDLDKAYRNAVNHYDGKLNVVELKDKDGNLIGIL